MSGLRSRAAMGALARPELHPEHGRLHVAEAHDDPSPGATGHDELIGDGAVDDRKGVVPRRRERVGNAVVERAAVVLDKTRLAVHQLVGIGDRGSERFTDGLVAEAHSEERRRRRDRGVHDGNGDAGVMRRSRTGRDEHGVVVRDARPHVRHREVVVAHDLGLGAQLQQVPVERVDEAVVVVDDENACHWSTVTSCEGVINTSTHGKTHAASA
jgi:hypothetical protein